MEVIKKIARNMKKRLALANCDIDIALWYKEKYPELAKSQYSLSVEEINHLKQQHDNIVALIDEFKKEGHEVPAAMQALYDFLHEEYIECMSEVKTKQAMFK